MGAPKLRQRVEVIIKDDEGRVLMGMNPRRGNYQFPGGGIDGGSVDTAARREAEEEAGVRLTGVAPLGRRPDAVKDPKYKEGYDGWNTHWRTAGFAGFKSDRLGKDGDAMGSLKFYHPSDAIARLKSQKGGLKSDKIAPTRVEILKSLLEKKSSAAFVDEILKIAQVAQVTSRAGLESTMEPGDILLTTLAAPKGVKGAVFRGLSNIFQGKYGHTALYAGNGRVYDTRFGQGSKLVSLSDAAKGKDVMVLRPLVSDERKKKALAAAHRTLGAPYAGGGGMFTRMILSRALPVSPSKKKAYKDIRDGLICSRMITRAYGDTSFGLKRHPEMVSPSEFLKMPGLRKIVEYTNRRSTDRDARAKKGK